jgi:rfaE bifunctional protein kinase chain/domain
MRPPPTAERLLQLVQGFGGRRVPMLVDLVADHFLHGTPKRISREAPVLILRLDSQRTAPGGGANAAANVAALGGVPLPVGIVGDDESGTRLVDALTELGISTRGIVRRAGYPTPTKTRVLAGGRHSIKQQIVRIDVERAQALSDGEREALARRLSEAASGASVGILSDYGYGTVDPTLAQIFRSALAAPSTLLCDSRYRLADYRGIDGATPNEEEAEQALGNPLADDIGEARTQGERLRSALGARFLLITRGSRGMNLFVDDDAIDIPVSGTDQVADVTGAGDTVIGTFALALAAGASPLEAALLANYAGGVVVMKLGTATLSGDELRHAIAADPRPLEGLRWAR